MKIRNGFVSNSSSSSFLIYGTHYGSSEIFVELIKKLKEKNGEEVSEDFDEYAAESYVNDLGLTTFSPDYCGYYVGRSFDEIADDETGKQFKESIQNAIKTFDENASCGTHEEAWYNG